MKEAIAIILFAGAVAGVSTGQLKMPDNPPHISITTPSTTSSTAAPIPTTTTEPITIDLDTSAINGSVKTVLSTTTTVVTTKPGEVRGTKCANKAAEAELNNYMGPVSPDQIKKACSQ
jgi:hypothetical protein